MLKNTNLWAGMGVVKNGVPFMGQFSPSGLSFIDVVVTIIDAASQARLTHYREKARESGTLKFTSSHLSG